ncbi:MAG: two-component regulator propeller domain-containing protein [Chitinophagaceae bacterium]
MFIKFDQPKIFLLLRYTCSIVIIFFFAGSQFLQAQQYLFSRLGFKDGLNQENIHGVQQDARGFIWIAAGNVLQRYDGNRLVNFFSGSKGGFPHGGIRGMKIDAKNRLWLLNGVASVGYIDPNNFSYHPVKVQVPEKFDNVINALYVDNSNNVLLIFINRGFITLHEKTGEMAEKYNPFSVPVGWEPTHLWQDADNNYWVGSINGLLKYSAQKKILSYRGHNDENDPVIQAFEKCQHIGTLYRDKKGLFWITHRELGVTIESYNPVNGEKKEWQKTISNSLHGIYYELWGLFETSEHDIWMAGPNFFARVNYEQHRVEPVKPDAAGEYSIRYDQVNSLFEDREKSIWVCTNKGLFRFNPPAQIFKVINNRLPGKDTIFTPDVTDFLETADGEMMVSTWGNGVFSYDKKFSPVSSAYFSRAAVSGDGMMWCILQRKNGDICCGMQDGILCIYEKDSKKITRLRPAAAAGRSIRQIAEDKNGNIWLGTQGGQLVKWNTSANTFTVQQQFKRLVSRILVDEDNNIWACTDNDGVYCINAGDGAIKKHYTATGAANTTLLINGAADILQYDDSTMVIISNGLNILNKKTGLFTYLDEGAELSSMVKDNNGYLWMTGAAGIICRQLKKRKLHLTFDARDGINNFSFNVGASALLKNGHIIFGTNHEFIVFDPEKARDFSDQLPEVQVAGLSVMDKWISADSVLSLGRLHLTHTQTSLTLHLTSNTFQSLYAIHYRLEEIDKSWKQVNSNGEINLNYLQPGKYILKAACLNLNGDPGKFISIPIYIAAPFYKTWWFYSLIALVLGCVLFWLDKERMKRKEAFQQMRTDIAANLHMEVNTALGNINILSEMAKLKAATEPQKSIEFIEQIHSKSNDMILAMDDMMWSISPENDNMDKTILRMREYIQALNSRYGSRVEMQVDEKVSATKADMQFRHEAFILFKESITGLLESNASNCIIYLGCEKNNLLYSIQFSTHCCDMQKLNNLLHSREMGKRMQAIRASIQIELRKSNSVLTLKVPVVV